LSIPLIIVWGQIGQISIKRRPLSLERISRRQKGVFGSVAGTKTPAEAGVTCCQGHSAPLTGA
jgi:hypothetical protein